MEEGVSEVRTEDREPELRFQSWLFVTPSLQIWGEECFTVGDLTRIQSILCFEHMNQKNKNPQTKSP